MGNCVAQVVIENPVINSPYDEPVRHFKFDESGITIENVRRSISCFVPIPRPRKTDGKGQQSHEDWRSDRIEENGTVNRIRQRVRDWRNGRYLDDVSQTADPLNLILEVTGGEKREKTAKVSTTKTLRVPAVKNAGEWGRWAFLEVTDPWKVKPLLAAAIGV